jgi:hypothetical protein
MAAGLLQPSCCLSELCQGLSVGVRTRKCIHPFAWCMPCILAYHHCSRVSFLQRRDSCQLCKRADPQWHPQAATITLRLLVGFVQSHLPLQKLHAISVFFLNLRKGLSSPSKLLAFCFPLCTALLGLPSSAISPWPASEEEPSTVVGSPGPSSNTESSSGLTKSSGLGNPGRQ